MSADPVSPDDDGFAENGVNVNLITFDTVEKSAAIVSGEGVAGSSQAEQDRLDMFSQVGAIPPPNDPDVIAKIYERSAALAPNVAAMKQNVDSFGVQTRRVLPEDPDERFDAVSDSMFAAAVEAAGVVDASASNVSGFVPSDSEVRERMNTIELMETLELVRLTAFLQSCCDEMSFVALRRRTRHDLEVFGYAFWEVIRNSDGDVAKLNHAPAKRTFLRPIIDRAVDVETTERLSAIEFVQRSSPRKFRTFVQVVGDKAVYFKQYGDPRVISRTSGAVYASEGELESSEEGAAPAMEMIHFSIYSTQSPYGAPRWSGAMPSVLGIREADEVNLLYFSNKSVPPLVITVSGGKLTDSAIDRIREHIRDKVKGKSNFHDVMVLEGVPAGGTRKDGSSGRIKIDIKPLTQAINNDGQFLRYDERGMDKVGMQWRMPRILRGDTRDFNRSTADAAVRYADMQVFEPERVMFDEFFNRQIVFLGIGVRLWEVVSNAPVDRDPTALAQNVRTLSLVGALTPRDGRSIAEDVFSRRLEPIADSWPDRPIALTIAASGEGADGSGPNEIAEDQ